MKALGAVLVHDGLISEDQLAEAEQVQQDEGRSLGRVLVERGYLEELSLIHI